MHQHTLARGLVLVAVLSVLAIAPVGAQAPATLVVAGYTSPFEKGLESSVIPAFERTRNFARA